MRHKQAKYGLRFALDFYIYIGQCTWTLSIIHGHLTWWLRKALVRTWFVSQICFLWRLLIPAGIMMLLSTQLARHNILRSQWYILCVIGVCSLQCTWKPQVGLLGYDLLIPLSSLPLFSYPVYMFRSLIFFHVHIYSKQKNYHIAFSMN